MRSLHGIDRFLSAKLKISSNLTPDITIDLAQATKSDAPASSVVSAEDNLALKFMKPEIILSSFGIEKIISPYGRPQAGMFNIVIVSLGAAALIGARSHLECMLSGKGLSLFPTHKQK